MDISRLYLGIFPSLVARGSCCRALQDLQRIQNHLQTDKSCSLQHLPKVGRIFRTRNTSDVLGVLWGLSYPGALEMNFQILNKSRTQNVGDLYTWAFGFRSFLETVGPVHNPSNSDLDYVRHTGRLQCDTYSWFLMRVFYTSMSYNLETASIASEDTTKRKAGAHGDGHHSL